MITFDIVNKEIKNLCESAQLFWSLDRRIYDIACGELTNSPYSKIYLNYETFVRNLVIKVMPEKYTKFIEENFTGILLDIINRGYTVFYDQEGNEIPVVEYDKILYAIVDYNANWVDPWG